MASYKTHVKPATLPAAWAEGDMNLISFCEPAETGRLLSNC